MCTLSMSSGGLHGNTCPTCKCCPQCKISLLNDKAEASPKCCPLYNLELTKGVGDTAFFMIDFLPFDKTLGYDRAKIKDALVKMANSTQATGAWTLVRLYTYILSGSLGPNATAALGALAADSPATHMVFTDFTAMLGGVRMEQSLRMYTAFKAGVSSLEWWAMAGDRWLPPVVPLNWEGHASGKPTILLILCRCPLLVQSCIT